MQGAGERLLAVCRLAQLERHHRGGRMAVVGSRDRHGVDARAFLGEELAVVGVAPRLGILAPSLLGVVPVDVGHCHDLFAGDAVHVVLSHAADAYTGDVELVAGGGVSPAEHMAGNDAEYAGSGGGRADELAT